MVMAVRRRFLRVEEIHRHTDGHVSSNVFAFEPVGRDNIFDSTFDGLDHELSSLHRRAKRCLMRVISWLR